MEVSSYKAIYFLNSFQFYGGKKQSIFVLTVISVPLSLQWVHSEAEILWGITLKVFISLGRKFFLACKYLKTL